MGIVAEILNHISRNREYEADLPIHQAQAELTKYQSQEAQARLKRLQMEQDLLSKATPEELAKYLFPKTGGDPAETLRMLKESGILGGGAPSAAPQAPPQPFGGGSAMFPLDPSVTAPPSLPAMMAQSQTPGLQLGSIDLGTGSVKLEPAKTRALKGVAGENGPVTIQTTEGGIPIPGSAMPEFQEPDAVEEQTSSGDIIAYKRNRATGGVIPGTMVVKSRVKREQRKTVLRDGTTVEQDFNPFTGEPMDGDATVAVPGGSPVRVVAPPPVTEFKFVDNEGVEWSAIKNVQTGQLVSTPVQTSPAKGVTATDAGKLEGALKALKLYDGIRKAFVNPDGTFNRKMALSVWAPAGGIGQGRKILAQFREGLDVKTRVMSGAAIRPEEEAMYKAIYLPHPLDDDATAIDKLNRFSQTMAGLKALVDPAGTGARRVEGATGGSKGGAVKVWNPKTKTFDVRGK